jgi:hypothetical protein
MLRRLKRKFNRWFKEYIKVAAMEVQMNQIRFV